MMKYIYSFLFLFSSLALSAQESMRSLSLEEYSQAKSFQVNDLDKDTYLKVDNTYILDKGDMPPPYFITGDDGLRKRIDLYQLIDKESKAELGVMIYYTNEKGKRYTAVLPSAQADAAVWDNYFEDIHATNEEEPNYVLKLAYVISKELSNAYAGEHAPKTELEGATYGTEICFPGDQQLSLPDGSRKPLAEIKAGEEVLAMDPKKGEVKAVKVKKLRVHEEQPYALTRLQLVYEHKRSETKAGTFVRLSDKFLEATPNHPLETPQGYVRMGKVKPGDELWIIENGESRQRYTVVLISEYRGPSQLVYSLEIEGPDRQPVLNEVAVMQKELN